MLSNNVDFNRKLIFLSLLTVIFSIYRLNLKFEQNQYLFVSSAFNVTEYGKDFVRILAMAKNGFDRKIMCYSKNNESNLAKVNRIGGYPVCRWSSYFIECPRNEDVFHMGDPENRHQVSINRVYEKKNKFVICYSRMFNFEKWQTLLAALHLNKMHGVGLMVIPISSVLNSIYRLLEEYESTGFIRLKQAPKLPIFSDLDYDPNGEVEWFLQVLSFNECFYEHRDVTDFIAFFDIDDVMFPRHYDTLPEELYFISALNPDISSFEFPFGLTSSKTASRPRDFSLTKMIKSTNTVYNLSVGKSVVRAKFVNQGFIHRPEADKKELLYGFKDGMFKNTAYVLHFRNLIYDDFGNLSSNNIFRLDSEYDLLDSQLKLFLESSPNASTYFELLPTQLKYYETLSKCYRRFAFEIEFSKLSKCPTPIECIPEDTSDLTDCVVVDKSYITTKFENNLQISSVSESRLVLKPNCLI